MRVPENRFEFAKQGGALLAFRDPQRHPSPPSTEDSTELKTEKSKTPSWRQIHLSALFLVHLHLEFRQLLPKALFHCLPKPLLPRMRIHQYHHIQPYGMTFLTIRTARNTN
jgi:hypothetical protein